MVCFSPNRLRSRFDYKGQVAKCGRTQTTDSITKKGIMDTQQNPNEPGKSPSPGQQGGQQQDRDREERERQERERQQREGEKQGGGQQGGGQQGGGQQSGR